MIGFAKTNIVYIGHIFPFKYIFHRPGKIRAIVFYRYFSLQMLCFFTFFCKLIYVHNRKHLYKKLYIFISYVHSMTVFALGFCLPNTSDVSCIHCKEIVRKVLLPKNITAVKLTFPQFSLWNNLFFLKST